MSQRAVTDDSHCDGENGATNYGTETSFNIRDDSDVGLHRSFVTFSLAGLPTAAAAYKSAVAWLYCATRNGGATGDTINNERCSTSWAEGTITWNNQPAASGVLVNQVNNVSPWNAAGWHYFTFNLTEFVAMVATNNGYRIMTSDARASNNWGCVWNSSENGSNTPYVDVIVRGGQIKLAQFKALLDELKRGVIPARELQRRWSMMMADQTYRRYAL